MNHNRNCLVKWIVLVLIAPLCISCHRGKPSDVRKDRIEKSINKAVSWVNEHPADFNDGKFIEIAEEIITFYIIYNQTKDLTQKNDCIRQMQKRVNLIKSNEDFAVQSVEYTMFLCIAYICEKLNLPGIDFRKIIENQILLDPRLYPAHETTKVWNTVYLERLGYDPPRTLDEVLSQSTLSKETQQKLLFQNTQAQFDPRYVDVLAITTYDLTHEIFSLTSFGEFPPPGIILDNQEFFSELFERVIDWAIKAEHVDILAEAIMCVKILNFKDVLSLNSGLDYIISRQEKDGSFGVTNPTRPNVYRHGTLVSIMALSLAQE